MTSPTYLELSSERRDRDCYRPHTLYLDGQRALGGHDEGGFGPAWGERDLGDSERVCRLEANGHLARQHVHNGGPCRLGGGGLDDDDLYGNSSVGPTTRHLEHVRAGSVALKAAVVFLSDLRVNPSGGRSRATEGGASAGRSSSSVGRAHRANP